MTLRRDPAFTARRALALFAVLLLAGVLRGSELSEKGIGHAYYGATVLSMLRSPHNFLFAAAEPAGSVSVDKPPLGFMLQTVSASVFGYNTVALALPSLVCGMLTIVALHALVGRRFGFWPGIAAALAMALTPMAVALDRTNLVDSVLAFTQIMAVAFGLRAAETGRLPPLLWSMVWFGLGFNVKMLQAAFAGPGVALAYLLLAPAPVRARLRRFVVAGALGAAVALAWVAFVQLTPPERRPWVGSTISNSVAELIVDYNGLMRMSGVSLAVSGPDVAAAGLGRMFRQPLRLFSGGQFYAAGFFLPLALYVVGASAARWRLGGRPSPSMLIWSMWLALGLFFLSGAGFLHSYYSLIYAVPAAALIGIGAARAAATRPGMLFWLAACAVATAYHLSIAHGDGFAPFWWPASALLLAGAIVLLFRRRRFTVALSFGAVCITPLVFSSLTSYMALNRIVPEAFGGGGTQAWLATGDTERLDYHPDALAFLQARTVDNEYLVAVPDAVVGAPYIVHSGRPVLYIGGFTGNDRWKTPAQLEEMTADGRLRYVYLPIPYDIRRPEFRAWLTQACRLVFGVDLMPPRTELRDGERIYISQTPRGIDSLFDCAPRP